MPRELPGQLFNVKYQEDAIVKGIDIIKNIKVLSLLT